MIGTWVKEWLLPRFGQRQTGNTSTVAAETTGGGDEPVDWVCVAAGLQPLQAKVLKSRLESENISAMLRQESIGAVMGLTFGALGAVSVWVPDSAAEQAIDILDSP